VSGSGLWIRRLAVVIAPVSLYSVSSCAGQSVNDDMSGDHGGDATGGSSSGESGAGVSGRAGGGGEAAGANGGDAGEASGGSGAGTVGGAGGSPTGPCVNDSLELDDGNGEPACVCPSGYAGAHCEFTVRDCSADDPPCDPETSATGCVECRRAHIDVGPARSCHIDEGGHVRCWGANDYLLYSGECELPGTPTSAFEVMSTGLESCALSRSGGLSCWGLCNDACEADPLLVPPSGTFVAVSVGINLACALDRDWELACSKRSPPAGQFFSVAAGFNFACALDLERHPSCVDFRATGRPEIVEAPSTRFRAISAGNEHVCGILMDGSVECWGVNTVGQASPPATSFRQVSAGKAHTCGVREDGTLECWGDPKFTGAPTGKFVEVAAGDTHSCALRPDAKVTCWGEDDYFQLHPPPELAPSADPPALFDVGGDAMFPDEDVDCMLAGVTHGCELDSIGRISCWGSTLGSTPAGTFVDLSVGHGTACALRDDGAVACWGNIVVEPGTTSYVDVSAGYGLACALRTTGEIDCFEYAGPMDGYRIVSPPVAPPVGSFTQVSVSADPTYAGAGDGGEVYNRPHACALATDGGVHCWGSTLRPVVDGPFVSVSAGHDVNCAFDAEGAAWCFRGSDAPFRMDGEYTAIGVGTAFYGLRSDGTVVKAWPRAGETLSVASRETFLDLSVGGDFACGLSASGHIRCFGSRNR
jgi:alpha-tubulin suppressor-like RCC1 family protein